MARKRGCVVILVYDAASLFYQLGLSVFFRRLNFHIFKKYLILKRQNRACYNNFLT